MARTRFRGKRILALLGVAFPFLLLLAWRVLIAWFERTSRVSGTPPRSCGPGPLDSRFTQAARDARSQIQAMMLEREIPGMSVAVAFDGAPVWSEGLGWADREQQIPACPETRFRIASVSKPLTVAAIARLYQQGRLDLDAPLQRYVPSFPDKGYPITARHLATHRSGIRHLRDDSEALNQKHYPSVRESLERFKDDPLLFPPGTNFRYSSYGYVLLSVIVEGASGEDFLSTMRRHIFIPLKMQATVADGPQAPHRAALYDNTTPASLDGRVVRSPGQDLSYNLAGGGFISTAEDLVRFGSAHMQGGFFKPETLGQLFTPQSRQMGIVGYAMGWMVARDLHLRRVYFHFGAGFGSTALLAVFPDQRVVVALLANLGHARFPFARIMGIVNPFLQARSSRF